MIQAALVLLCLAFWARWLVLRSLTKRNFAPGPPCEPLIGHLRLMPAKGLDMFFYEMGKKYGNIVNLRFPGQNLLVLNSVKPAMDLLDARSANYSGRPRLPLAEVIGISDLAGFMDYNDEFCLHRKILQKHLAKDKLQVADYRSSWQRHATILAHAMLSEEADWYKHLIFYASAIVLELTFGHRMKDHSDPYLAMIHETCSFAVPAIKPDGRPLVDIFPFLTKLPSWVPGNFHVENARKARKYFENFRTYPYADVQRKMAAGQAKPCILVSEIADIQDGTSVLVPRQLEAIASVIFTGGVDSVAATLATFIAAMVLFPDVQTKGQEEIDKVVGNNRLPDFGDRDSLPYLDCIVQEVVRWRPAASSGVPHLSKDDDEYDGYYIPKNTIVMPNLRGMSLDETVYRDPTLFIPDRFKPKPEGWGEPLFAAAFGFGRRICPGRYLVSDTMWIAIATLLATINIGRPKDSLGNEYVPDIEWETLLVCRPTSFSCAIEARNPRLAALLSEAAALAEMAE